MCRSIYLVLPSPGRLGERPVFEATVVGPICESGDVLGSMRPLPKTSEGDIILVATVQGHSASATSLCPPTHTTRAHVYNCWWIPCSPVAVLQAGAYGRVMSSSYNLRTPPLEVFLPLTRL
jgi:diaminopimelate decarboxylase